MIRNPSIKQLLKAAKEGKSVLCNICECEDIKGRLMIGVDVVEEEYLIHESSPYSIIYKTNGRWRWTTRTPCRRLFNPEYLFEAFKMRRSIIILP